MIPYFDAGVQPSDEVLKLKMIEGTYVLLNTDRTLYASLFDFVDPWKIDIIDYLNENYMYDLSLEEIASYTGHSLATFKRDFAKVSDLRFPVQPNSLIWKRTYARLILLLPLKSGTSSKRQLPPFLS